MTVLTCIETNPMADAFDPSIVPVRRPTERQLDEDGQLAMYDPAGAGLVVLNESATAIWDLCDGSTNLGAIVECLGHLFAADPNDLQSDVWATYLHLVGLGLVTDARSEV